VADSISAILREYPVSNRRVAPSSLLSQIISSRTEMVGIGDVDRKVRGVIGELSIHIWGVVCGGRGGMMSLSNLWDASINIGLREGVSGGDVGDLVLVLCPSVSSTSSLLSVRASWQVVVVGRVGGLKRCGETTKSTGKPCKNLVKEGGTGGGRCVFHQRPTSQKKKGRDRGGGGGGEWDSENALFYSSDAFKSNKREEARRKEKNPLINLFKQELSARRGGVVTPGSRTQMKVGGILNPLLTAKKEKRARREEIHIPTTTNKKKNKRRRMDDLMGRNNNSEEDMRRERLRKMGEGDWDDPDVRRHGKVLVPNSFSFSSNAESVHQRIKKRPLSIEEIRQRESDNLVVTSSSSLLSKMKENESIKKKKKDNRSLNRNQPQSNKIHPTSSVSSVSSSSSSSKSTKGNNSHLLSLLSQNTVHSELRRTQRIEEKGEELERLEGRDEALSKLKTIFVVAYYCTSCQTWFEKINPVCISSKHKINRVPKVPKSFFECQNCKWREGVVSCSFPLPPYSCNRCGEMNWKSCGMKNNSIDISKI